MEVEGEALAGISLWTLEARESRLLQEQAEAGAVPGPWSLGVDTTGHGAPHGACRL